MTQQPLIDRAGDTRILWEETPQSFRSRWRRGIRALEEDDERHEAVGTGHFYVTVWEKSADLALFYCPRPGCWETMIIDGFHSPLQKKDLIRSVKAAGGDLNRPGHYPLDEQSVDRVRAWYSGASQNRRQVPLPDQPRA